jgi:hypothetical protein
MTLDEIQGKSKMEEHKHHSMGGLADPCAFSTKPTHPP